MATSWVSIHFPGEESGEVEGLPTMVVGDAGEGEEGRPKGDVRGELKDSGDGLYVDACAAISIISTGVDFAGYDTMVKMSMLQQINQIRFTLSD